MHRAAGGNEADQSSLSTVLDCSVPPRGAGRRARNRLRPLQEILIARSTALMGHWLEPRRIMGAAAVTRSLTASRVRGWRASGTLLVGLVTAAFVVLAAVRVASDSSEPQSMHATSRRSVADASHIPSPVLHTPARFVAQALLPRWTPALAATRMGASAFFAVHSAARREYFVLRPVGVSVLRGYDAAAPPLRV